ncbi:hypothetical protein Mp_4g03210 [Marchantia polymorpha subsp. ruderalis]|uniref:Phosphate transporter n=2 Tax=Marchantia polymorpha TaxID=3197 RepID=A0AAF6B5S9_MARPO|nr:hypothetical protein MARPO_0172s0002 [Marchantia polymorpha]PTQ28133.1 hypothetical protein MARPO_0172s0005 [Marchantia polymorpha]BBN07363.1 hypothetical protein Mp_4g03210 [Marchantia polymorpha subsp. ruderalis]|eukprot:PTQ28130.1 hypothetical protein MARPO_0172s0002 [Marchantia polymorpha]
MAVMSEYLWFVIVGAFVAFAFGWGNGANDLANGFATSVGSKTLTMGQAVLNAQRRRQSFALSLVGSRSLTGLTGRHTPPAARAAAGSRQERGDYG